MTTGGLSIKQSSFDCAFESEGWLLWSTLPMAIR